MNWLSRLFGRDDKFFSLLEAGAAEAQNSVRLLVEVFRNPDAVPSLDEFIHAKRKEKRIAEEVAEQLCKTFVTPLDREDIEALSVTLYKIPKTVEKFSEKYVMCHQWVRGVDFRGQIVILEKTTAAVAEMVGQLRRRVDLETMKERNNRLHELEGEADQLMRDLLRDLYGGRYEPLQLIVIRDLYEILEKIIDRCRDAGNVMFQIVLKYS